MKEPGLKDKGAERSRFVNPVRGTFCPCCHRPIYGGPGGGCDRDCPETEANRYAASIEDVPRFERCPMPEPGHTKRPLRVWLLAPLMFLWCFGHWFDFGHWPQEGRCF